ncbi:MAG: GntR family transcriptional regulator [Novosphingobium sp.]
MSEQAPTALNAALGQLRALTLSIERGTLIGSEEMVITRLGFSRSTVRQAARMLEREGLLKVRRGPSGGYFADRPDAKTIEAAVSAYLQTLDIDVHDTAAVATALWNQAVRKATEADRPARAAFAERLRGQIKAVKDEATFGQIRDVELRSQDQVFELARSAYIRLIFDINTAFSRRHLAAMPAPPEGPPDPDFVRAWREAKLIEVGAIAEGGEELAGMAAQYSRSVWERGLRARLGGR